MMGMQLTRHHLRGGLTVLPSFMCLVPGQETHCEADERHLTVPKNTRLHWDVAAQTSLHKLEERRSESDQKGAGSSRQLLHDSEPVIVLTSP